jgi:hypothetical protein
LVTVICLMMLVLAVAVAVAALAAQALKTSATTPVSASELNVLVMVVWSPQKIGQKTARQGPTPCLQRRLVSAAPSGTIAAERKQCSNNLAVLVFVICG